MDTALQMTVFNRPQLQLLKLFQYEKAEERLDELQDVIVQFYQSRLEKELDKLWDEGVLDQQRLDEINEMDLHKL